MDYDDSEEIENIPPEVVSRSAGASAESEGQSGNRCRPKPEVRHILTEFNANFSSRSFASASSAGSTGSYGGGGSSRRQKHFATPKSRFERQLEAGEKLLKGQVLFRCPKCTNPVPSPILRGSVTDSEKNEEEKQKQIRRDVVKKTSLNLQQSQRQPHYSGHSGGYDSDFLPSPSPCSDGNNSFESEINSSAYSIDSGSSSMNSNIVIGLIQSPDPDDDGNISSSSHFHHSNNSHSQSQSHHDDSIFISPSPRSISQQQQKKHKLLIQHSFLRNINNTTNTSRSISQLRDVSANSFAYHQGSNLSQLLLRTSTLDLNKSRSLNDLENIEPLRRVAEDGKRKLVNSTPSMSTTNSSDLFDSSVNISINKLNLSKEVKNEGTDNDKKPETATAAGVEVEAEEDEDILPYMAHHFTLPETTPSPAFRPADLNLSMMMNEELFVECKWCQYSFCSRCQFGAHPGKPCRLISSDCTFLSENNDSCLSSEVTKILVGSAAAGDKGGKSNNNSNSSKKKERKKRFRRIIKDNL